MVFSAEVVWKEHIPSELQENKGGDGRAEHGVFSVELKEEGDGVSNLIGTERGCTDPALTIIHVEPCHFTAVILCQQLQGSRAVTEIEESL